MQMFVSVVQPVWPSVLFLGLPLNFQGQSRQVLGLSVSENQVTLLLTTGSTSALDATSVIWFVRLA